MDRKHCLVTGANRGLGLELVRQLLGRHCHVVATCRQPGKATALNTLAGEHPGRLHVLPLDVADLQGIDASSAPNRWRACFRLTAPLPAAAEAFAKPEPSYAPGWFDCFDADQIGADLESGAAKAYLSQPEIRPDVDRVIAVYPDGRAYGWHQINDKTPERGVMD